MDFRLDNKEIKMDKYQRALEEERLRKKYFDEAINAISVYIKDPKKTDYGIKTLIDSEDMFLESPFLRGVRQG
jgi:hypothetical protein